MVIRNSVSFWGFALLVFASTAGCHRDGPMNTVSFSPPSNQTRIGNLQHSGSSSNSSGKSKQSKVTGLSYYASYSNCKPGKVFLKFAPNTNLVYHYRFVLRGDPLPHPPSTDDAMAKSLRPKLKPAGTVFNVAVTFPRSTGGAFNQLFKVEGESSLISNLQPNSPILVAIKKQLKDAKQVSVQVDRDEHVAPYAAELFGNLKKFSAWQILLPYLTEMIALTYPRQAIAIGSNWIWDLTDDTGYDNLLKVKTNKNHDPIAQLAIRSILDAPHDVCSGTINVNLKTGLIESAKIHRVITIIQKVPEFGKLGSGGFMQWKKETLTYPGDTLITLLGTSKKSGSVASPNKNYRNMESTLSKAFRAHLAQK